MKPLCLALCVTLAAAPSWGRVESPPAAAPRKALISVAVLELSDKGVGTTLAELVGETVLHEVHKLEGVKAIGMSEIQQIVAFEKQRALVASCTEGACLAELAGALGVDRVITGTVGRVGDSWLIHLRLLSMKTNRAEAQASERIAGGTGEEFLDAVGPLVAKLFPEAPLKSGEVRGAGVGLRARAREVRVSAGRGWALVAAGAAAAFLGSGVGFGLGAKSSESRFKSLNEKALAAPLAAGEVRAAASQAKVRALISNIGYAAAGAAAITTALLFALSEPRSAGEEAVRAAAVVAPTAGGATLFLSTTF